MHPLSFVGWIEHVVFVAQRWGFFLIASLPAKTKTCLRLSPLTKSIKETYYASLNDLIVLKTQFISAR
jgi:hypothetical protein